MTSWRPLRVRYSQNMSPVQTTQPTDRPAAGIPPLHFYSHRSPYLKRLTATSSTSMTPGATHSASNIDFTHLSELATSRTQATRTHNHLPHDNAKVGDTRPAKTVLPYPINLTPVISNLRPHCTAKDRLEKWPPHPDSLPFLGPPETFELQERVRAVTLEGWAESTRATYGAGLLVYHIFAIAEESRKKIVPWLRRLWFHLSSRRSQAPSQAKPFATIYTESELGILCIRCRGFCTKIR